MSMPKVSFTPPYKTHSHDPTSAADIAVDVYLDGSYGGCLVLICVKGQQYWVTALPICGVDMNEVDHPVRDLWDAKGMLIHLLRGASKA